MQYILCGMWTVWKVICRKGDTEQAHERCADDEAASCREGESSRIVYTLSIGLSTLVFAIPNLI